MDNIGNLYIMIGAPGSGKSTFAKNKAKQLDGIVHSSDDIREELANKYNLEGGAGNQSVSKEAFEILYQRTLSDLKLGKTVFYDATNTSRILREQLITSLRKDGALFNAYPEYITTDLNVCKERNIKRFEEQSKQYEKDHISQPRIVPEKVIERMHKTLEKPFIYEGYSENEEIAATSEVDIDLNASILNLKLNSFKYNFENMANKKVENINDNDIEKYFDKIENYFTKNPYINFSLIIKTISNNMTKKQLDNYFDCIETLDNICNNCNFGLFMKIYTDYKKTDMTINDLQKICNLYDENIWQQTIDEIQKSNNEQR